MAKNLKSQLMKYQSQSSIVINAKLDKVRSTVGDFKTWKLWSPWTVIEPDHKFKITGKACTVGHSMSWDGEVIGAGNQSMEAAKKNSFEYKLVFLGPWKSTCEARFDFKETKAGTKVTWTLDAKMPFFLFFMTKMMKSWIEMDFQRGLTMLKSILEEGKINAKTTNEGVAPFEGFDYIGIKKTSEMDKMPEEMSACFGELMEFFKNEGKQAKHWITIYPKVDMANKRFTYIAAASAENLADLELPKHFEKGSIKSQNMLQIKHRGSYLFLGNAWSMGMMVVRGKKLKQNGKPFEYYWNNPSQVEANKLKTSIFFPLK